MKKKKLWVALVVAAILLSLAAPVMAADLSQEIEADVTETVNTHTDTYQYSYSGWWPFGYWDWKFDHSTDDGGVPGDPYPDNIGSLNVTDDSANRELDMSFGFTDNWYLISADLSINGQNYDEPLGQIPYAKLGKGKTVQFDVYGEASKPDDVSTETGDPYWAWDWIWLALYKDVTTTTTTWSANFLLSFLMDNPNYKPPVDDYYYYEDEGSVPGEIVIGPEEPAVAPCPFWALMERAEALAGALSEESGWDKIWEAKYAYWDANHQYLICRDEHFTVDEKAEAAERLAAVWKIISAY